MTIHADVLRPFVEKAVAKFIGTDGVFTFDDGTIPGRAGSTAYFVQVRDGDPPRLTVRSPLISSVACSAKLLRRLNSHNADLPYGRLYWEKGTIYLETDVEADSLDTDSVTQACAFITVAADDLDDQLQAEFGGQRWAESHPEDDQNDSTESEPMGSVGYL